MNKSNRGDKNSMKKLFISKTSALLVSVIIASLLLPIVAFAATGFDNVRYDNSLEKVTGRIYVDNGVYGAPGFKISGGDNDGKVLINVYTNNGSTPIATTYATYVATGGSLSDHYYYEFALNNAPQYYSQFPLKVSFRTAANGVYVTSGSIEWNSGSGSGYGGGGGGTTTTPGADVTANADGSVNAGSLSAALAADGTATVSITGDVALLPASALTSGQSVTIVTDEGVEYVLPLDVLGLDALAASLGTSVANLTIRVEVTTLTGAAAQGVEQAVEAVGGDVVAPAVDFKIVAVAGSQTKELGNFSKYISRTLPLNEVVTNPNTVTGVVYTPGEGVSFVPTVITTENGKSEATLKRNDNSIYTVVKVSAKSFADLNGHWAKADVEKLAGKLVITGTSATTFEPKRSITRAEVAALLVRSLGLDTNVTVTGSTYSFSDVTAGKWYSKTVTAAVYAGIIKGYEDRTFKPDAAITRRDLAAMVVRAQAYAGKTVTLTDAQVSQALAGFTDAATLGGQRTNVAIAVSSGLLKGQTGTKIAGLANTNRAEAATLIARLLQDVDFID